MNAYWKAGIGIILAVLCFLAGWYTNGLRWQKKAADALAEEQTRRHEMMQGMIQRLNETATAYQQQKALSEKETDKLKQELKNVKAKNPLPAACRLDADRLRIIQQAVHAANHRTP